MPPKLRQDLYDASAVATLVLAGAVVIAWLDTWPGWIVPRVLSVVGIVGYVVARLLAGVLDSELAVGFGAPPSTRRWTIGRGVVLAAVTTVFLIHYIVAARVIGALILGLMLVVSLPRVYKAARRRYARPSHDLANTDDGSAAPDGEASSAGRRRPPTR